MLSGAIANVQKVILLGSQTILAQFPNLPETLPETDDSKISVLIRNREILFRSIEADILIPDSEEKTEIVEGAIGELSLFHNTFGYYAQAVDLSTSKLPEGWEGRLVEICNENTNGKEQILFILESDSEESERLRSSSPFTGILNENERKKIFEFYRAKL